jgi:SAM-dependent methyltransferase
MPARARFDCLWCGTAWTTRGPDDLEGWALLCPDCLGKAGTNPFLRGRLRTAIAERGAGSKPAAATARTAAAPAGNAGSTVMTLRASEAVRGRRPRPAPAPAFPDDWFLRRGPFERGAIHDAAWAAELDVVTRWLDEQPLAGRIDEPAAGVGFFSPLLASKGELHASDPDGDALDRARDRLVAHRLLAHIHVADPWAGPEPGAPPADALVAAFLLGRVRGAGLDPAANAFRARLRPGGRLALIDLLRDAHGGPPGGIPWTWHDRTVVEAALGRAGFVGLDVRPTGRFFLLVSAEAG